MLLQQYASSKNIKRKIKTVLALIQVVGFLNNSDYIFALFIDLFFLTLGCIFQYISLSFCFLLILCNNSLLRFEGWPKAASTWAQAKSLRAAVRIPAGSH